MATKCFIGLALVHTAQKDGHPFIFFLSLKKKIVKVEDAGVEPRPLAPLVGMITTTLRGLLVRGLEPRSRKSGTCKFHGGSDHSPKIIE